jgi:hypothetical protein
MVEKHTYTIKRNSSYLNIENNKLKFLDITNFFAQGYSYSDFLKAYGIEEQKSYWPYEWFDNTDKLEETCLPPYDAYYSTLKRGNTLNLEHEKWLEKGAQGEPPQTGLQKYEELQQLWTVKQFATVRQYLEYYNNLDTKPFVQAVDKMLQFYNEHMQIDVFKDAVSVPGIARRLLFKTAKEEGANFALFPKQDEDLYLTMKKNLGKGD